MIAASALHSAEHVRESSSKTMMWAFRLVLTQYLVTEINPRSETRPGMHLYDRKMQIKGLSLPLIPEKPSHQLPLKLERTNFHQPPL